MSSISGASTLAMLATAAALNASPLNDFVIQKINMQVKNSIEHVEAFQGIKAQLSEDWNQLISKGELIVNNGTDKEYRPRYVGLQGMVEQAISLLKPIGVVHTSLPCTPLRTKGELSPEIVNPEVLQDPLRAATVKARTTILRDLLHEGGVIYAAYPKEALLDEKLSLDVYREELKNYPANLFDHPLDIQPLETSQIGAFYLFKDENNELWAFAIKMTQASTTSPNGDFGMWFNKYTEGSSVKERIDEILRTFPLFIPELHQ